MRVCICNELKSRNEEFSIPHINNFFEILSVGFSGDSMTIFIQLDRLSLGGYVVEMGIDKHMVASLCRLRNNAISMSLVCNSFS